MARIGSKPIDELVRRAIIGDGTAFTALWDTNIDSLKSYLKSLLKNMDDFYIDDICSRSFQKAFRQISSYDPSRSQFSTWLRKIAHNTAMDVVAAENRAMGEMVSIDGKGQEAVGEDGLPELYREVARKRLIEGLQYKEIAEELGMELNTVRTRIRRAKGLIENMKNEQDS